MKFLIFPEKITPFERRGVNKTPTLLFKAFTTVQIKTTFNRLTGNQNKIS